MTNLTMCNDYVNFHFRCNVILSCCHSIETIMGSMEYIASEHHVNLPVFQSPMEKYKILFCTQNNQYHIFKVPIF